MARYGQTLFIFQLVRDYPMPALTLDVTTSKKLNKASIS